MRATKPATIQPNIYENGSLEWSWRHAKPHGPDSSNKEETRLADTKLRLSMHTTQRVRLTILEVVVSICWVAISIDMTEAPPTLPLLTEKKSPLNKCPSEASPKVGG